MFKVSKELLSMGRMEFVCILTLSRAKVKALR